MCMRNEWIRLCIHHTLIHLFLPGRPENTLMSVKQVKGPTYFLIPPPGGPPDKQIDAQRRAIMAMRCIRSFGRCVILSNKTDMMRGLVQRLSYIPSSLAAFRAASSAFFLSLNALSSSSSSFLSFLGAYTRKGSTEVAVSGYGVR